MLYIIENLHTMINNVRFKICNINKPRMNILDIHNSLKYTIYYNSITLWLI